MKLSISFLPDESAVARGLTSIIKSYFKKCKIRETDNHPPYKHIYIAIEKPGVKKDSTRTQ